MGNFKKSFLFVPNLLFPLPAGIVFGLLKYIGPLGGPIAYGISIITGGCTMLSICQCCLYRFLVFYHFDRLLELVVRNFVRLQIIQIATMVLIISAATYTNSATYQELLDYAKRHGHQVPADVTPETPLVAFDLDNWKVTCGLILIGGSLFIAGIGIGVTNMAVKKKIQEARKSMSAETYRIQKSLTVILLAQALIPGISIVIPILIYCIAMGFSLTDLHQSTVLEWFSVLIIGSYPFVNSAFCLYYMKPYWRFTRIILLKIIWCYSWSEEVVPVVEVTGSSSNPQQN